jgi:hypothetical membrane protein
MFSRRSGSACAPRSIEPGFPGWVYNKTVENIPTLVGNAHKLKERRMFQPRQVWITGFLATAIYLICTAAAFIVYPLAYSPLANWLSDLGNPLLNPKGAFLYNLGCVLTGICLIFFFLGLEIWSDGDRKRRTLLTIAQVTGILSSLALIVSAFYPLGAQTLVHSISGKAHIFFTGFFLTFSATVLLKQPHSPKWLAYLGFFAALINFIYGAFLHAIFLAEWAAIGVFILYVLMISGNTFKQAAPQVELIAGQG